MSQKIGEGDGGGFLPVDDKGLLRRGRDRLKPMEEFRLVRVTGDAPDRFDLGADFSRFPVDPDRFRPPDDLSTKRSFRLITAKEDHIPFFPDMIRQVMFDSTGVTHSGGRENDRGSFHMV